MADQDFSLYSSGGADFQHLGDLRSDNGLFGILGRVGNTLSGSAARDAAQMKFNATEAQKQRDWQEYMSSTAYQRTVKDMKAAGINPATMTGLNASTGASSGGSGSAASSSSSGSSGKGASAVIGALFKMAIAASVLS